MVDPHSTPGKTRTVGVVTRDYNTKRNFSGAVVPGFDFVPTTNALECVLKGMRYAGAVRAGLVRSDYDAVLRTLHYPFPGRRVDLYHFWNTLSLGRKPWVVSAESLIPRWKPGSALGARLMAGEPCRRIISISENARKMILAHLETSPSLRERIAAKMTVLHPPQPLLPAAQQGRDWTTGPLRLAFVGHEFYRKGGYECLVAIARLLERKVDIHLTVVSSMSPVIYGTPVEEEVQQEAGRIMARHADHIEHFPSLPHADVERLFLQSHAALLPSYVDTYGYSVLEAQAAGCPVVTTDIRTLPEINNNSCGWVIPVAKDDLGNALFGTAEARNALRQHLASSLEVLLEQICSNRSGLAQKSAASLRRIAADHDPAAHAMALRRIYQAALGLEPALP